MRLELYETPKQKQKRLKTQEETGLSASEIYRQGLDMFYYHYIGSITKPKED